MIFGPRWEITLRMHLEGSMHIGSGISSEVPGLLDGGDKVAGQKPPEVSLVQRDNGDRAIIPATSLKGALRAQAPLGDSERDGLLGEQGEAEAGKGRIARLWLGHATAEMQDEIQDKKRFQGMTKEGGVRPQGFVKTALRIERRAGTSEERLLYNREVVGPGTAFVAQATLFLDGGDEPVLQGQLARLLAPLATPPGLLIGGQRRQAGGRLRLDDIEITRQAIDPATLDLRAFPEPDLARSILREAAGTGPRGGHEAFRLCLTCKGPYISVRDKTKQQGDESEVTRPLKEYRRARGGMEVIQPLLWPSSLLGALRARAAWLAEVQRLRQYPDGQNFAPRRNDNIPIDDRDNKVRRNDDVKALSSVERLFGVAGWRGLVSIASMEATDDGVVDTVHMTSVTIDRFTGGGIDQRLFTEETFLGARFICELRLEDREKTLQDADRALFRLLLKDIRCKGLELGHGGAKGFGWFAVETVGSVGDARKE